MNISVFSNANASTRSISFDLVGDVLASDDAVVFASNTVSMSFYVKITTSASQDNGLSYPGNTYPAKVARSLSDLALRGPDPLLQKQSETNTANAYADIKSMIIDYTYDFINGHTANQYGSGCTAQSPMKFN